MVQVVGVRFKKAGKIYYFDPAELPVAGGCKVVVETARGIEFGDVAVGPKLVDDSEVVQPLKRVIRIGTEKDATQVADNRRKEREAFAIALRKIASHGLDMNLVDVEYTFDSSKIIFYFTAEGRVDFRELVKDLASVFRTRIEMRQIGVRDEAKLLGGIGPCGRILCCTSFLGEFAPVSIRMAKDQNLSLNPTKISGVCGRLMCCLRYEQETYEAAKKDPTLAPGYVPPILMDLGAEGLTELEEEVPRPVATKGGQPRTGNGEGQPDSRVSRALAVKTAVARDAEITAPIRISAGSEPIRDHGTKPDRSERGERSERRERGKPQVKPEQLGRPPQQLAGSRVDQSQPQKTVHQKGRAPQQGQPQARGENLQQRGKQRPQDQGQPPRRGEGQGVSGARAGAQPRQERSQQHSGKQPVPGQSARTEQRPQQREPRGGRAVRHSPQPDGQSGSNCIPDNLPPTRT